MGFGLQAFGPLGFGFLGIWVFTGICRESKGMRRSERLHRDTQANGGRGDRKMQNRMAENMEHELENWGYIEPNFRKLLV